MKFPVFGYFLFFLLVLTGATACKKSKQGSNIPTITFLSVTPTEVQQGSSKDTVWISFKLEDGDSDITADGEKEVIFVKDMRDNTPYNYPLPKIEPPTLIDPSTPLEATCRVGVLAAFLLFADPAMEADTLQLEVYVKDNAGHESNRFTTPDIYLTK